LLHDRARSTKRGQRHPAPDHLAQHRDVWTKARQGLGIHALRAAQRHTKTCHHFIEDQQRAVLGAQLATTLHEGHLGTHEVHVAGDRLDHQAGDICAVQREGLFELRQVVVLQHQRVLHHLGGHACAGGVAKGGETRAGLDQQSIGVAVVTAFKLDQLATTRRTARQTNRRHGRFSARAHQSHHVHRRHVCEDGFGQFDFTLGGRAKREAFHDGALHRVQHRRVTMPQNHRAPGADVVDVALAVGVPEVGPLCPADEARGAAHCAEGAHR